MKKNTFANIINCLDWLHTANSLRKDFSSDYETIVVYGGGRTPNDVAAQQGPGWEVGFVDWDTGKVTLHRYQGPTLTEEQQRILLMTNNRQEGK